MILAHIARTVPYAILKPMPPILPRRLFGRLTLLGIVTIISSVIYIALDATGEASLHFGANWECLKYLGCTTGFFGYDALEHFACGFAFCLFFIWFFRALPKYSLLTGTLWKDALILVSMIALIAVIWEIGECAHDVFRLNILHEHLINVRLHINLLDQPSNLDTVGDLTFNVVGSILALVPGFMLRKRDERRSNALQ